MRIQKKQIIEAVANSTNNTSNTTSTNNSNTTSTQNNDTKQVNLPKPEDVEKSEKAVDKLNKKVDDINDTLTNGPMSALFKKINEFDEPNYGMSDDLEYLSSTHEKLMSDYNDWLGTPDGIEYMKKMNSELSGNEGNHNDALPFNETFKSKKRIIKTIKVKDLKNG